MIDFSVLISLYKLEKPENLKLCLQSIHIQTLLPSEVIIVLDGPVGEPLKSIIEEWTARLNIKVVSLRVNVGLGRALNHGMNFCTHELIARMDTDDICLPNRFELQIREFIQDSSLVLVGATIQEFDGDVKNITGVRHVPELSDAICEYAKYKNPFNHMTVVFKKSVIQSVGGYQHHHFMEDYNLWVRLISAGYKTKNLQETLLLARTGVSMVLRRKGLLYIKSEYQLAKLKYDSKMQNILNASFVFLLRSIPRLMPVFILFYIYKCSRK